MLFWDELRGKSLLHLFSPVLIKALLHRSQEPMEKEK